MPTEIDYLRSAGFVILASFAVGMTLLVTGRWAYRRWLKSRSDSGADTKSFQSKKPSRQ